MIRWLYLGVGVLVLALAAGLFIQTKRLERTKQAFDTFKAEVKVLGEQAERDRVARIEQDEANRKAANEDHDRTKLALAAAVKRLRERPGSGLVPAAPAGSSRPDLACYDRSEFERAYRDLISGVRGIADEGTAAALALNTAREWARRTRLAPSEPAR